MKKTIELKSRYGDTYLLNRIGGEDSHLYSIGDWGFCRLGETNDGKKFLDPSGGPFIAEGSFIREANATVKEITFPTGSVFIEFE